MVGTYELTNTIGQTRLLINDVKVEDEGTIIFGDPEITAFLNMTSQVPLLAAALALDALAADEAMTQKAIRLLDLTTNGPQTADALRATATSYRNTHAAMSKGGGSGSAVRPTMFARLPGGRGG